MSSNMDSYLPLYIPLDRISHRDTPTVKSDLIPWTHIADRQDLFAAFEKEMITTQFGHIEQQTVVKIKAGVKIVDTLVLEDLVCQAAVQERRLPSSPSSTAHFAIFTSHQDMAFRYRLPNGHFRKIQVLFRYKDGFESAVKILNYFNLPIVHKDAPSQCQSKKAQDAPSISTHLSMGAPTVFSHVSQSTDTKTTPQSLRDITTARSLTYGHRQTSVNRTLSHQKPPTSQYSSRIVRPGPSLIESIVETDDEQFTNRWRSQSVLDSYNDGDMFSKNYGSDVRAQRDVFENRLHTSAIEQSYGSGRLGGSISHGRYPDEHLPRLQPSYLSRDNDIQEDLPISSQYRLSNNRNMFDSPKGKDNNERVAGRNPELISKIKIVSQATSSTSATTKNPPGSKECKQNEKSDVTPARAAPKKRQPKRIFKATASQTESSSISKSTQTKKLYAYVSGSVQTEPTTFTTTNQDRAIQTEAYLQNSAAETVPKAALVLDIAENLINNLVTSPLPKKCWLPVNKFGKERRYAPILAQEEQKIKRYGKVDGDGIHTDIMLPRRCTQGINKFGRTRRKVK